MMWSFFNRLRGRDSVSYDRREDLKYALVIDEIMKLWNSRVLKFWRYEVHEFQSKIWWLETLKAQIRCFTNWSQSENCFIKSLGGSLMKLLVQSEGHELISNDYRNLWRLLLGLWNFLGDKLMISMNRAGILNQKWRPLQPLTFQDTSRSKIIHEVQPKL